MKNKISFKLLVILFTSSICSAQTIEVITPNGRENWQVGSIQQIEWNTRDISDDATIKIEVSRDGQLDSMPVFENLNNNTPRKKDWTVSGLTTLKAKINISASYMSGGQLVTVSDESNDDFSISMPSSISIITPSGGEIWEIGQDKMITWTSIGIDAGILLNIEISRDNGTTYQILAANVPNNGSYSWIVTGPEAGNARMKIGTVSGSVSDETNFNICEPAVFSVEPDTLFFSNQDSRESFVIKNTGSCALDWSAAPDTNWISLNRTAGRLFRDETSVEVSIDLSKLCGGKITRRVVITGAATIKDTVYVSVNVANDRPDLRPGHNVGNFDFFAEDVHDTLIIDIARVFYDPNNDKLDYTARSANPEIVEALITSDDKLELIPLALGEAIVTLRATDSKCAWREVNFKITVGNRRPRLRRGRIPDATMIVSGPPLRLNLDSVFVDDDKEPLTYTPRNSGIGATILENIPNSLLIVKPQNPGLDTITVTADDSKSEPFFTKFGVLVNLNQPPEILDQTGQVVQTLGAAVGVMARVQDDIVTLTGDPSYLSAVTLYYRRGGTSAFTPTQMQLTDPNMAIYNGVIPEFAVTDRGVEYYFEARDTGGAIAREPKNGYFSVRVQVPLGLSKAILPGRKENEYRLFSVPLELLNKDPKAILESEGNLGKYDDSKWRFAEPQSNGVSRDFPNVSPLQPGKAFWLLVKEPGKSVTTGEGTTNRTDKPFEIQLNAGWNFIGNPFNFEIPIIDRHVRFKHGVFSGAQTYLGSWEEGTMFLPFEGYAIYNHSDVADTLLIDPNFSPLSSEQSQFKPLWEVRISAVSRNARDANNSILILNEASPDWDRHDAPEPPPFGNYIALFFPHPEWQKSTYAFTSDARPIPLTGETWAFEVVSNIHDRVDLTFEGIAQVPIEFEVWLVDTELQITRDLRRDNHYSIVGPGPANPKRLKLVVGKKEYVEDITRQAEAILTTFELSQNFPNPFNPASTIRYGLPHAERVTLRVYNLLGEEVATLIENELKTPGYHTAIWNGRNSGGERAGSGVYVYKLQAGSFTQARKMLLIQ